MNDVTIKPGQLWSMVDDRKYEYHEQFHIALIIRPVTHAVLRKPGWLLLFSDASRAEWSTDSFVRYFELMEDVPNPSSS